MNIRLTLKNDCNEFFYCIIKETEDAELELEKVFSITKGYGFSVRYSETQIRIIDYFHGETRASFDIVSKKYSHEECIYQLMKLD